MEIMPITPNAKLALLLSSPGSIFDPYIPSSLSLVPAIPFSWLFTICNQCSITTSSAPPFSTFSPTSPFVGVVVFDRNFAFEIRTRRAIKRGRCRS